jgi:uncharacterized membrane protein YkvA (DUF1232 family)
MANNFDKNAFWKLIKTGSKECALIGLKAWYVATSDNTPAWAKTIMWSALAYFVLPVDAIPDVIPIVGFTDDVAALGAALGTCATYITPEVKLKAEEKAQSWFG